MSEKQGFWARRKKKDAASVVAAAVSSGGGGGDLFGQTLRTVAILVGACVLFVGSLSAAAVVITSKAMGSPNAEVHDTNVSPAAKKPMSI